MKIAVCWKWVSVDREREADRRWAGVSAADEAALEVALSIVDDLGSVDDAEVTVVCLGPPAADDVLREAIAVGATTAVRIDASTELDSRVVAVALAGHLAGTDLVLCGDHSLDRGTGSVPAFVADELARAQALGLLEVAIADDSSAAGSPRRLRVVRRLDGGRREILEVALPAVLSVEGSVANLRRASLAASLSARRVIVTAVPGPHGRLPEPEIQPFRPRARSLPAPSGDVLHRIREILDVGGGDVHAELVTLEPPSAASKILDQLHAWGYLASPGSTDPEPG